MQCNTLNPKIKDELVNFFYENIKKFFHITFIADLDLNWKLVYFSIENITDNDK